MSKSNGTTRKKYAVADLFAGAGGYSSGAKKAIEELGGIMDLLAVNHWNTAIATHQANHPTARHLVEDVSLVDPEAVVEGGRLDILLASPECKHYSRARGGKPIHDQGRMNPWAVHNWLTKIDVRCVLIENVPEFVEWGPLLPDGRPDKAHKGDHFQAWFLTFISLGYQAEWRCLNAADYGDATTRIRFFLQARKDGLPIVWPEPSHAKGHTGMFPGRLPWRGAREIIDWSHPGRSLLDDPKYQKKPLSEKTRQRIARGLERFGGPLAPLYIRLLDLPGENEIDIPAGKEEPFLLNRHGENGSNRTHSVEEPVPTATTRGAGYLVETDTTPFNDTQEQHDSESRPGSAGPFHGHERQHTDPTRMGEPIHNVTTPTGGGEHAVRPKAEPSAGANRNNNVPKSTDEPMPSATTTTGGGKYLVEPEIQPFITEQQRQGDPRATEDHYPTVEGPRAIPLVRPFTIEYYGDIRSRDVGTPLSTITQRIKHGLINPTLVVYYGQSGGADVDRPLPTVTKCNKHALASPMLVELQSSGEQAQGEETRPFLAGPSIVEVNHGSGLSGPGAEVSRTQSVDEPLRTITTKRGIGLVDPILVQTSQTGGNGVYARSTEQPIPTLTTQNDMNIVQPLAYIVPNFGERDGQEPRTHDVDEPTPTVTSRGAGSLVSPVMAKAVLEEAAANNIDPRRVVFVEGQPFLLDIRFRMLQNEELARAMGFDNEEQKYEFVGTVAEVTKQIGNAVPVNLATALVKAALYGHQGHGE